ncbi:MAG: tetratricopeptide repeat protein [Planctomycetaceae bacterium]|nr:tetratricopeptide repeat protein [Planctomycetaceae bacterium]
MNRLNLLILCTLALFAFASLLADDLKRETEDLEQATKISQRDAKQTLEIIGNEDDLEERSHSIRGDAYFFLSQFDKAVADYNRMIELNPQLKDSHWRRGIALYYAGEYEQAANQFERYHSYDNVDRENGIWRYFCQVRAYGEKRAREDLLKYEKDDREPFPRLYELFAGKVTPKEILESIHAAELSPEDREQRLFYAELYVGLNHAVHQENEQAIPHLEKAVLNKFRIRSGYGPSYMWQVGRVQLELLRKNADAPKEPADSSP